MYLCVDKTENEGEIERDVKVDRAAGGGVWQRWQRKSPIENTAYLTPSHENLTP